MRNLIFFNFILILLFSVSCKKKEHVANVVNYRLAGEEIILPDSSNIRPKLKIETAQKESHQLQVYSAAKIKAIPNNYAEISAPFNGRITESFVKLGQDVDRGTPLFAIYSSDYTDAQKMYLQDRQQYLLAEKDFKRQKDLLDNGVGVQRDYETARTTFENSKSELEKATASIRIFGVDPDKMIFGEPLVVRSPIHGQVIKNTIVVGKYLTDNSNSILTVAEISKVWIIASVKEKDIRFIEEGDQTEAEVTAYPGEIFKGTVYHIDEIVDEETRSINVLIECSNRGEKLKPGMYATVKFTQRPGLSVFVPSSALLQYNDRNFVFVQTKPWHFKKQIVTTAETTNDRVVITEGLSGGESIIAQGGFYLLDAK
ncbi:MAG: efflux RND transporter periplasmic adaptor subunit [Bacteroidetes bacterium]|nr:efflux RND transporter periplasmic adaptor subunit [Bacteroidota bacterium]